MEFFDLLKESFASLDNSIEYRDLLSEETKFIKRGDKFFDTNGNEFNEVDSGIFKERLNLGFYVPKKAEINEAEKLNMNALKKMKIGETKDFSFYGEIMEVTKKGKNSFIVNDFTDTTQQYTLEQMKTQYNIK